MGMGNLLTTLGEEVGNMLISCPDIPHIFSVHHRESSTESLSEYKRLFAKSHFIGKFSSDKTVVLAYLFGRHRTHWVG